MGQELEKEGLAVSSLETYLTKSVGSSISHLRRSLLSCCTLKLISLGVSKRKSFHCILCLKIKTTKLNKVYLFGVQDSKRCAFVESKNLKVKARNFMSAKVWGEVK